MSNAAKIKNLDVGQRINLSTYGNTSMSQLNNVTFLGTVSGEALPNPTESAANHSNIFPLIPQEIRDEYTDDYRSYTYLLVREPGDSVITAVGIPWVVVESLAVVSRKRLTITLDDSNENERAEIMALLEMYGNTVVSAVLSEST